MTVNSKFGVQPARAMLRARSDDYTFTITQIALELNIPVSHVRNALDGRVRPNDILRQKLPQILGLPLYELFTADAFAESFAAGRGRRRGRRPLASFTLDEHVELGTYLFDVQEKIQTVVLNILNRYQVSKTRNLRTLALKAERALSEFRSALDDQLSRDHGDDGFCPHVYYPGLHEDRAWHKRNCQVVACRLRFDAQVGTEVDTRETLT